MDSVTTGSGGTSGVRIVTRKSLFDKMKNKKLRDLEEKLCFLRDHLFTQDNLTENQLNKLKHNFAHFKSEIKRRWTEFYCLYVKLYPWHPMTPTLHKILVHGSDIIKNALLPEGQLSEEAAEARNKHFRSCRQDYSRKFSRESCSRDILNRLLLSSNPFFSASRVIKKNKKSSFLPETLNTSKHQTQQMHFSHKVRMR